MNKIKKITSLLAFMILALAASAQQKDHGIAEKIKQGTANLKKDLGLTDAQASEIEQVNTRFQQDLQVISKKKLDNKAKNEQMRSLFSAREEKLKTILTAQQYTDYKKIIAQKRKDPAKNIIKSK